MPPAGDLAHERRISCGRHRCGPGLGENVVEASPFDTSGIEVGADGIKRYTGLQRNVVDLLQHTVKRYPELTAVVELGGPSVTYAELWDRARRVAGGLRDAGVGIGDRVALQI